MCNANLLELCSSLMVYDTYEKEASGGCSVSAELKYV